MIHEQILRSLRYQVHLLEDDELFEQTLLRGSQAALSAQPESGDIDALMRSMMATNSAPLPLVTPINHAREHGASHGRATTGTVTAGPWNHGSVANTQSASQTSTPAVHMRGMKGAIRGRR